MKEQFIDKNFGSDARSMIVMINGILSEYEADGYDLSLRQLYYQLVARNVVPNTERSYKNVGTLVSDARLAGLIDWDIIKDRGRKMIHDSHWDNPAEIVRTAAQQFRIDRWEDQPCYVEVMVEKQALRMLAASHGTAGVDLSTYVRDVVLANHEPYQKLVEALKARLAESANA
mgnify:CR=1 FL=1